MFLTSLPMSEHLHKHDDVVVVDVADVAAIVGDAVAVVVDVVTEGDCVVDDVAADGLCVIDDVVV